MLIAGLLGLAGCASVALPPPTGPMWAFFTDTDLWLGPHAVIYMTSQVACETERQHRVEITAACVPVVVSPGAGYYAVTLPSNVDPSQPAGVTFGSLDQQRCERLRMMLFRASSSAMGDCGAVSVKRGP